MGCINSAEKQETSSKSSGPKLDPRLPFDTFRNIFTLKNYWKSVCRAKGVGNTMLFRFLKTNPEHLQLYTKLKDLPLESEEEAAKSPAFERIAKEYLQVFDDVITEVEASPSDVEKACNKLKSVGKMHKKHSGLNSGSFQAMEEPFLHMVSEILQDRFNDKAENLFRKFFQFCLKYLVEGYNNA